MVNAPKVEGLLRNLATYVGYLHKLALTERATFLGDSDKIGAAKYYLQVAIEVCIDLANHIISTERYRAPKDYRDVFTVLNENGLLPDDFTLTIRQMAGLRNLLVHLYWEVDDAQIYTDLQDHLDDFDRYAQYILDFVKRPSAQGSHKVH
jgi:uncharacterized protein YutE (UPF0331/DUF86 family)